jgi:hypothetical protein
MYEHEYHVEVPELYDGDSKMEIAVDKFGGGTVGSEYAGSWFVTVYVDGNYSTSDEIITGTPKTHEQVAKIHAGFLAAYAETTETGDRLSLFNDGE